MSFSPQLETVCGMFVSKEQDEFSKLQTRPSSQAFKSVNKGAF